MILNPNGDVLENTPFFNTEFVKTNKVKSMRGNYATKFDMDIIRPNEDAYIYEFDRLGQMVRQYKIHFGDTLINTFQYDYKGNIMVHRESNKFGYHEYRYKYDQQNRLIEMEQRRDKKSTYNKLSFELDPTKVVSAEKYEYIALEGNDFKRMCYNSVGRIYRIEFYYFDKKNRITKKESALHNGRNRIEVLFFYDEENRIIELKTISKFANPIVIQKLFEYGTTGELLSKKVFRAEKIISEEQLVYSEDTKLLKAIISRGAEHNKLTILKFDRCSYF
jgi:hypothetical protein